MRPQVLFPLFANLPSLQGVGPKLAERLENLCGPHVVDLIWHLPFSLIDRRFAPKVAEAPPGVISTLTVQIDQHIPSANRRLPYKVLCSDETGNITLVFFHAHKDYLTKMLPVGETRIISGKVEVFGEALQMPHPDHIGTEDEREQLQTVEPVYPLTGGVSLKVISKAINEAMKRVPELEEWLDASLLTQEKWVSWSEALQTCHHPDDETALLPNSPHRQRLAYDEILANQLALAVVRRNMKKLSGRSIEGNGALREKLKTLLPYTLTGAQVRSLSEIDEDMASSQRMLRLLHGDVGSGKTIVALLAALTAVESGHQAAIMAPTEILARQHLETIQPFLEKLGVSSAILTGRDKGQKRQKVLEELASGNIQIIIGTHALFQDDIEFKDLALAVIDEQHRFGVHQRMTLASKGTAVDVLVMTATPIPRTLVLTTYGDMDVSRLDEKPEGRKPIKTVALPNSRLDDVVGAVSRALKEKAKIYWVCPLVEESEVIDAAAAEQRFDHLKSIFGDRVALVHGRMKGPEKDEAMNSFAFGNVDILVATTVIEVGVNVPEATVMVIEHAERFGLAQLHQLRGRIGRGDAASNCLLLYAAPLSENARSRLKILRETEDGFRIAEEDLRLRGGGELLGTKQSGLPEFKIVDLAEHADLLEIAKKDADLLLHNDPELTSKRGKAIRTLLYLFERDSAIKLLRSG
ncbi:MAG: ATP-dependent DNA helicase RecG [Rhodospirillales bacterium]|nr:ATP-dependent DNA helicase RecG [Rhodospirillales bacterium]